LHDVDIEDLEAAPHEAPDVPSAQRRAPLFSDELLLREHPRKRRGQQPPERRRAGRAPGARHWIKFFHRRLVEEYLGPTV
jgi:hypothetical protein